jgi:glutaredoxin-like protein
MALIGDEIAGQLKTEFQALVNPVRLVVFSQALADPESEQVRRVIEELAALHPLLRAESHNFVLDKEKVDAYGVARIPAIAVLGETKDYGIRMYGLPTGYEFGSLIDAILDVSKAESGLSAETKAALAALERPVHIQVFSTPTCPYCPRAVRLAYQFAIESDKITADGVEVTGYPDLARKYQVSSVPKTVVGETEEFVGAAPEATLLKHVQDAAAAAPAGLLA